MPAVCVKTLSPTIGLLAGIRYPVSTNLLTEYSEDSLTLIFIQARNHWLPQRYFQAVRFQLVPFRLL
jgi:hypothetical protein